MNKTIKKGFLLTAATIVFSLTACSNDEQQISEPQYQTAENHIALKGEDNMRDLGGYKNTNGKRILYRKLFRSGELSALNSTDINYVEGLKIKNIIDLRTDSERTEKPDVTINGATYFHFSLLDDSSAATTEGFDYIKAILTGEIDAVEMMLQAYVIDDVKINNWIKIFDELEKGENSLWHCTAGKDRAGMTTALVLASLDIDKQTIVNDFMLSNTYLEASNTATINHINEQYGPGMGEKLLPLLGVQKLYIDAFLNDIDLKYGGMDQFLNVLKVDKKKMKEHYLEK